MKKDEVGFLVHSRGKDMLDTFNWAGKEECDCKESRRTRIDERNLFNCKKLDIQGSSIVFLDTRYLGNLIVLSASNSKLASLDTVKLGKLKRLHLWKTNVTAIDTANLSQLEQLWIDETAIAELNTRPLGKLEELHLSASKIRHIDLRWTSNLRTLYADSVSGMLDLSRCAKLTELDISDSFVSRFAVRRHQEYQMLYVDGSDLKYVDLRGKCLVAELVKDRRQVIECDEESTPR